MGIIEKTNRYLNKWLKDRDFECTVRFSSDFSYDTINNVIDYSFIVVQAHDDMFLKVCQSIRPEITKCDTFILSFFHELGHHMTEDDIDQKDFDSYLKMEKAFANRTDLTDADYMKYYTHTVEWEATAWACDYIVEHSDEIAEWFATMQGLEQEYINELEESLKATA